MILKDIRKKNVKELNIELLSLFREQFNLRMQAKNSKFKKYHLLRIVRRNIARIKTLLTEKQDETL